MRVIRRYSFNIGTKIPFAQWPEIVQRYLTDNGLTYRRFLYRFEDNVHEPQMCSKACERLQTDCPAIGESCVFPTQMPGMSAWVLTNIGSQRAFDASVMMPLMGKIHRTYGFDEILLAYCDLDFFGRVVPHEAVAHPLRRGAWQLNGSGIWLCRDAVFSTATLEMTIDVLGDGQLLDAAPYCAAMQKLLPKVRVRTGLEVVLTQEEKQQAEKRSAAAAPVLERSRDFFAQRLPAGLHQRLDDPRYSLAGAAKKLARLSGYAYRSLPGSGTTCTLHKRTARGNVLEIWLDVGPSHSRLDVCVRFKGIGFSHVLGSANYAPEDQAELEAVVAQVIGFAEEYALGSIQALDACFPESPDWFEPD